MPNVPSEILYGIWLCNLCKQRYVVSFSAIESESKSVSVINAFKLFYKLTKYFIVLVEFIKRNLSNYTLAFSCKYKYFQNLRHSFSDQRIFKFIFHLTGHCPKYNSRWIQIWMLIYLPLEVSDMKNNFISFTISDSALPNGCEFVPGRWKSKKYQATNRGLIKLSLSCL